MGAVTVTKRQRMQYAERKGCVFRSAAFLGLATACWDHACKPAELKGILLIRIHRYSSFYESACIKL